MAAGDKKDLESFLNKVEEIESIVKGLNSSEDETVKEAVKKADDKIAALRAATESTEKRDGTTGFNKTMINKSPPTQGELSDPAIQSGMSQAAFMHAMEEDSRQRAERRKVNQKEADAIKEEGNSLFKRGEFLQAVELYTKALRLVPDSHLLYTNRAQARIKMGQFKEALSDCDWALRAFPNCTKAFVHQGRAYVALGKFAEARESYTQGLQTDPKKEKIFTDYLAEVDRCERARLEEARAREWSESGAETATGLTGVLTKLTTSTGQVPLFYSGGFRVLAGLLTGVTERTLFRTEGGLQLHVDHPVLNRCLSACPKSLSQEELDLVSSAVDLYCQACLDNDVSQDHVLETGDLPSQLMGFLSAKLRGHGHHLKKSIIAFLHCLSISSVGRHKIVTLFPLSLLTNWAMEVSRSDVPLAVSTLAVLNNLALDDSFRKQMRVVLEDKLLPAFISLLTEGSGKTLAVLSPSIHMVVNLCGDAAIRSKLRAHEELWRTCLSLLNRLSGRRSQPLNGEICGAALALLVNMSCETSPALSRHSHDCCLTALSLTPPPCPADVMEQSVRLVSLCLPQSAESVQWLTDNDHLPMILRSLQSDSMGLVKSALKCLTVCTQSSERARTFVVDNQGIHTLTGLLESGDEAVVGNAALCLSHCVDTPSVCASLADTNIVQTLLVLARDGHKPALQGNCGILLARLAKGDNRHLERLRDLHGIEILHQTCGKHLK